MISPQLMFLCAASLLLAVTHAKHVVEVTDKTFKSEVLNHPGVVFVEFYAPWCGHCKNFAPEYEAAAGILNGVVKVAAVDGTASESLAQKYGVQGFPTVKVFGADKKKPVDFQGARTSDGVVSEAMKAANALVRDRKKGGKGAASEGSGSGKDKPKAAKAPRGTQVVTLTEDNFEATVLESADHWLVEFYAPWCGHCKNLEPEWKAAARQLHEGGNTNIKLGAVDATVATGLASKYGVKGFPTIKVFGAGSKRNSKGTGWRRPQDYNGPREADGIVAYALQSVEVLGAALPVTVEQVTSAGQVEKACGADAGSNRMCAFVFLPHILDSGAAGREAYLTTVKDIASGSAFKGKPITFLWSEGGAQPGLEEALQMPASYPSLAVVHANKSKHAALRLSWGAKNIEAFLGGLMGVSTKGAVTASVPMLELPGDGGVASLKVQKAEAWDGKDAEPVQEEMSLADIMGDD